MLDTYVVTLQLRGGGIVLGGKLDGECLADNFGRAGLVGRGVHHKPLLESAMLVPKLGKTIRNLWCWVLARTFLVFTLGCQCHTSQLDHSLRREMRSAMAVWLEMKCFN